MEVFDLVKGLAPRESVVNECIVSYNWPYFVRILNTEEPLQPFNFINGLQLPCTSPLSAPTSHPFMSTRDTSFSHETGKI